MRNAIRAQARLSPPDDYDSLATQVAMSNHVCAIIPAHNEAAMVGHVVALIYKSGIPVVVVDDHSQDDTTNQARTAGAFVAPPQLGQHGYSAAILRGFSLAQQCGAKAFLTIDADGAHNPSELEQLLRFHLNADAYLTIGDRFTTPRSDVPSAKRWANYFASSLLNMALGTRFADVACGMRAYSSELVELLLASDSTGGYALPYEAIMLATSRDERIASCPVSVRYDASGLLYTKASELLDFLSSVASHSSRTSKLYSTVSRLSSIVSDRDPFSITINGTVLCVHPIEQGYLFERQDEAFHDRQVGARLDLEVHL
jgi:glycosyltransferase involved in cell wall biosynthesis